MSEADRKIYLNNANLGDHDKMLEYAGARSGGPRSMASNPLGASLGSNPMGQAKNSQQ